jgi:hypothetical protein
MSDLERRPSDEPEPEHARGPNLVLLYGLIALALVVAMSIAALIVLPFYRRR